MNKTDLHAGEKVHGFIVKRIADLPDLRARLYILEHEMTGAGFIHFENEDDNNLFSVAFRTTPDNSTGVAHILEHTVLCGSKKYPVRDPFFSMIKRSLNTFMNAFTANDWTMYPFSTQNEKDFYNLMEVYLDAAFFPRINERSFMQEGWRLEFLDSSDKDSQLVYKGVVYNEMKGAMSDPNSLMVRRLQKALYPTTTYHYNSGGEPADIPDLTWEGLKAFHSKYYHPSNSRFFTYGSFPFLKHLEIINDQVLSRFDRIYINTAVVDETRFSEPISVVFTYPADPSAVKEELSKRSMASVAWLTCQAMDSFEVFSLKILSSLLLGNAAAPLYKALMDSKIGSALAPATGYDDENRETCFAAGLQGIDAEDAGRVEKLVLSTLERLVEEGFSRERIEAVIHQAEFSNKEVVGNHFPYSLTILFRLFGSWIHDGDPVSPLLINEHLDRLRKEIDKGPFFQELIRKHFLNNGHRVTVVLRPDPEQGAREAAEEAKKLEKIKTGLDAGNRKKIVEEALALQEEQEREEDISCLPTLELWDIPIEERPVEFEKDIWEGTELYRFDQPTNGISYFKAIVGTTSVPEYLKPYVPLFCSILTRIGAAGYDYMQMAERIEAHTGGISAAANIWENLADIDAYGEVVEFSAKALPRNHDRMFEILSDIFREPDFRDFKRLHTLIGQIKASMENSVPGSGHSYARGLAARHLTPAARLRESWTGIHQLRLVKDLALKKESDLGDVADKLEEIAGHLLNKSCMKIALITESLFFDSLKLSMRPFLNRLPEKVAESRGETVFKPFKGIEGWSTNVPVSYVAHVFRTVPYHHDDSHALQVLAKLLRSCYIHREVREKGGAYGGYAAYSASEGLFSFLSYRDPQLERTLQVYRDAIDWVLKGEFSDEDLKEAILGVFGDLDKPLSPVGKGGREFVSILRGLSLEMRQTRRRKLLDVGRKDIVEAAKRYLKDNIANSSIAVISSKTRLEAVGVVTDGERFIINKI